MRQYRPSVLFCLYFLKVKRMTFVISDKSKATEHFLYSELTCPCCDGILLSPLFIQHMKRLELLRRKACFRITINSGYRCEKHNRRVKGVKYSMHRLFATDIRPTDWSHDKLFKLQEYAIDLGFTGIGDYWTFLHIDLRKKPCSWDNRKPGAIKR